MNAPCPPTVLMATAVHRSNTDGIAWSSMSRATQEATGRRHRATTCSVLPQRPPGQQANKQQSTNAPKKVAQLMAMAMRRYVTVHISQWRRFRALLYATKCHHQANIAAISRQCNKKLRFFWIFHHRPAQKRAQGDVKVPENNWGMTYQSDGNVLRKRCDTWLGMLN